MYYCYSWSLFWFLLITEGAPSRLQRNNCVAFGNHLFEIPTIFEKNFSCYSKLPITECCEIYKLFYEINLTFSGVWLNVWKVYVILVWEMEKLTVFCVEKSFDFITTRKKDVVNVTKWHAENVEKVSINFFIKGNYKNFWLHIILSLKNFGSESIFIYIILRRSSHLSYACTGFSKSAQITFCFGVSSNLSQEKSLTAEILGKYFLRTIVPRKYIRNISALLLR